MRISDWSSDVCSSDLDASRLPISRAAWSSPARASATRRASSRRAPLAAVAIWPALASGVIDRSGLLAMGSIRWVSAIHIFSVRSSRSEEHTSELQSLMRHSYAVFGLKKQNKSENHNHLSN